MIGDVVDTVTVGLSDQTVLKYAMSVSNTTVYLVARLRAARRGLRKDF